MEKEEKFIVKEISGIEKSKVEVEEQLLKDHEEKFDQESNDDPIDKVEVPEEQTPVSELNDADVLSYIKNRYDKDIESVDQLFETKESNEELPEDVSAYFKYKKETGRSIQDFVKLQQNYDEMDSDKLLSQYYSHQTLLL